MKHILLFTPLTKSLVGLNLPLVHTRSRTLWTLRKVLPHTLSNKALRVSVQLTLQESNAVDLILRITQLVDLCLQLWQLDCLRRCHKLPVRSGRFHDPAVLVKHNHPRLFFTASSHHGHPPQNLVLCHRFAKQYRQFHDLLRGEVVLLRPSFHGSLR